MAPPPPPGRIYGDDPSVTSPRLVALRAQKTSLLQEQRALRLRLEEDGRDWGEVSDATAIAKRLADMDRVRSIDNDIVEVDDEIEDAVMRAREGGMETEGGFNQRAGVSSGVQITPATSHSERQKDSEMQRGWLPWEWMETAAEKTRTTTGRRLSRIFSGVSAGSARKRGLPEGGAGGTRALLCRLLRESEAPFELCLLSYSHSIMYTYLWCQNCLHISFPQL